MVKEQWVQRIKADCTAANTYKPYFDNAIDTLAQILETRDKVHEQYVEGGCQPTIVVTTDRSNKENIHKNPLIHMEIELNNQALKYWVELGLTASSFKKLNVPVEDNGSLADILKTL